MIIDFGAGPWPKPDATVRVDINRWPTTDVVHDLSVVPYPFDSDVADKVYMGDVIEHLSKFILTDVLGEVYRILKPGGVLDITTPDIEWIAERIYKKDWAQMANVDWLNRNNDPFEDAMEVIYAGWVNEKDHKIPGMGHINGFNKEKLEKYLSTAGFRTIMRVPDMRNPAPARDSVLRILAYK